MTSGLLFYWKVLHFGVVPPTALLSIVANGILMHAMRMAGKWDTTTITFFVLTTSDLCHAILALFGSATRAVMYFHRETMERLYPVMMPGIYWYVYPLPLYFSKTLLTIMSMERFIAICFPTKLKQLWTNGRLKIMMISSFGLIVLLGIPKKLYVSYSINLNDTTMTAVDVVFLDNAYSNATHALFVLAFEILPNFIICTLGFVVVVMLRRHVYAIKRANKLSCKVRTEQTNKAYVITDKSEIKNIKGRHDNQSECATSNFGGSNIMAKGTQLDAKESTLSSSSNSDRPSTQPPRNQRRLSAYQSRVTVTFLIIAFTAVCFYIPGKSLSNAFIDNSMTRLTFVSIDFCKGLMYYMELINSLVNSVMFVARGTRYRELIRGIFKR